MVGSYGKGDISSLFSTSFSISLIATGETAVGSLNMGLGGLALQEVGKGENVGMAPEKNEAKSEKGSYKQGVVEGEMEEVMSDISMDKQTNKGFGGSTNASNTEALSAKKSSLVQKRKEGEEEAEEEEMGKVEGKKRAPSICSCEYDFYHSRNIHNNTSMERQKK